MTVMNKKSHAACLRKLIIHLELDIIILKTYTDVIISCYTFFNSTGYVLDIVNFA